MTSRRPVLDPPLEQAVGFKVVGLILDGCYVGFIIRAKAAGLGSKGVVGNPEV